MTAHTPRSPAHLRREGNHLLTERSLYLQQHAHNPVDWYPWTATALERALAEDKPVFLSIGYSSCHWCHVMEREVFEQDDIAAFLNEHFVCIKVDREERPDLDALYMDAVQLLSGGGGWPMSVFLTPTLHPFFGATYLPREHFLTLSQRLLEVFRTQRDSVQEQAKAVAAALAADHSTPRGVPLEKSWIDEVARQGQDRYDARYGGFRSTHKFPTPLRWSFLLHHYRKYGEDDAATRIRHTLDAMSAGGLRDHVGGGFHRYAVDAQWLVPHFEKMLYDNAQMASLYLEAAQVFEAQAYAQVARDTLQFLLRDLADPSGGFHASYDADSNGQEGEFYVWTPAEFLEIAGPTEGPPLASLLGATEQGNFAGKNVLTRTADPAEIARQSSLAEPAVLALFDKWRPALLRARSSRPAPTRDRKVVTAWNGLVLAALSQAQALWREERWLTPAVATAEFLWNVHRNKEGSLYRASNEGVPTGDGILDDYSCFAWGLLELFQTTGELKYAQRAKALIDHAIEHFSHPLGGFYLTSDRTTTPLGRKQLAVDAVEPSGQAMLVQCLFRLGLLLNEESYLRAAEEAFAAQANTLRALGIDAAWWADAALRKRGPQYQVVVAGESGDLLQAFYDLAAPQAVLVRVSSQGPDQSTRALFPATEGKVAREDRGTAYVCQWGSCLAPTSDPQELRAQVLRGWKV